MNTNELIQTQLNLECIGLDRGGLLVRIPGPNPDEIARIYVYRCKADYSVFFRCDLSPAIRERISQLPGKRVFHDSEAIKEILAIEAPCPAVGAYRTCLFPAGLSPDQFPDTIEHMKDGRRGYAIVRDGTVLSSCISVRENNQAGECYVFTEPEYRRRGYASQTAAAWAYHLRRLDKVPFYSHSLGNQASKGLAERMGLMPCFHLVNYD